MPITQEELARRLRLARDACGLTQEAVAQHLGVSRPAIAQLELGNRAVSSLELDGLAYLYGRDIREFLADDFREEDALVALFRLHPDVSSQEDVQAGLRASMEMGRELTNLERLLGIERDRPALPAYPQRAPHSKWEAVQQGEQVAIEERRRLQLGNAPLPDVAEILESQGVRTAQRTLPDELSGLTLFDERIGPFVVVNDRDPGHRRLRRRFSYAHEYCHVVLDRGQKGAISRSSDRDTHIEVRANAFAAAILMPREGVLEYVERLGKGRPSRLQTLVFDEGEAQRVEARPAPGSQALQMHDVVLVAHHFGTSRLAALYRMKNVGLLTQSELETLKDQETSGVGREYEQLLGLGQDDETAESEFRHRFMALALEAFRRDEITLSKLRKLAEMVEVPAQDLDAVIARGSLEVADSGDGAQAGG